MTVTGEPITPRQALRFTGSDAERYDAICALFEKLGVWEFPAELSGDLEDMDFLDKAYWIYKSSRPIERAVYGSGLESFFADQRVAAWLPFDFQPDAVASISAVGDLLSHPYLSRSTSLYADAAIDAAIFGTDLAMANLECVVTPIATDVAIDMTTGPQVAIDPHTFAVVTHGRRRGYDFICTANNHSLDFGSAGVLSTIAALRDRNIAFHGTNEREEHASRGTILDRNGIRFGLVSHTFGLNGRPPPSDQPHIVNHTKLNLAADRVDFTLLATQLAHCLASAVDFTIVQLHWGMEFERYPRPAQLDVAHRIAELGADAIIGHHPHVVQPVEWYRTRRDPDRLVPIYYSLGNLTNPFSLPYMWRSAVARLELAKGRRADGTPRTYVRQSSTIPVEQVPDAATRTLSLRRAGHPTGDWTSSQF